MDIDKTKLKRYLEEEFIKEKIEKIKISPLGKGCLGVGYLLEFVSGGKKQRKILKSLYKEHMGSEYPADRAQSLIMAHQTYNLLENHIKSLDVIGVKENGDISSVGDAKEFFILMDEAKGRNFFEDIKRIAAEDRFSAEDKNRIIVLAEFLAKLHKKKFKSESLYKRKLRDTIGSGASIMGVLDMYPQNLAWFSRSNQAKLVGKAVEHWSRERYLSRRLCRIHGDFHPGNIWFGNKTSFTILDRSRGEFGEAADDITAFLINFIFYSIVYNGNFKGALTELYNIFVGKYFSLTKDKEMSRVASPYWAFRTIVVCNPHPHFYPNSFFGNGSKALAVRKKMLNFGFNVLEDKWFEWEKINDYLAS